MKLVYIVSKIITRGESMTKKQKKNIKKKSHWLSNILLVICLGVFLYCGYQLVSIYLEYEKMDESYDVLREATVTISEEGALPTVDLASLREINPEIVGYLYIPDTNISYPVTQAKDNDKYLDLDASLKSSRAGSIFVDANNNPGFVDQNTIIYGHHMKNGSMFKDIQNYCNDANYLASHQDVYLYLDDGIAHYRMFSSDVVEATSEVYTMSFASDEAYAAYLDERVRASHGTVVSAPEKLETILTFSTCTNVTDTSRYVAQAYFLELLPYDQ